MSLDPTYTTGSSKQGKKINLETDYEPWVQERFSGYLAIDEVYDGPFAIFYAVDPVARMRVAYRIANHADEIETRKFLLYLRSMGLSVQGITTDDSPLYPRLIREIFPNARHQICEFHIKKELNKLVLRVLSQFRKKLAARVKKIARGRPKRGTGPRRDHIRELKRQLWENRILWVKKRLTPRGRLLIKRIGRSVVWLEALRLLVDWIYELFDRRCTTATARERLRWVRDERNLHWFKQLRPIFKKLDSPSLDEALWFLDDPLLEATSNAVERANRRHRKIQKTIYRARAKHSIEGRIKYDFMLDLRRQEAKTASLASNGSEFRRIAFS